MKRYLYLFLSILIIFSFSISINAQPGDTISHTEDTIITPPGVPAFTDVCGLTAASVPFADALGCLAEDNTNFFYTDGTNLLTVIGGFLAGNNIVLDDNTDDSPAINFITGNNDTISMWALDAGAGIAALYTKLVDTGGNSQIIVTDSADTIIYRFNTLGNLSVAGDMTLGFAQTADTDYKFTMQGQTNSGIITWMEDEAEFDFDSGVSVKKSVANSNFDAINLYNLDEPADTETGQSNRLYSYVKGTITGAAPFQDYPLGYQEFYKIGDYHDSSVASHDAGFRFFTALNNVLTIAGTFSPGGAALYGNSSVTGFWDVGTWTRVKGAALVSGATTAFGRVIGRDGDVLEGATVDNNETFMSFDNIPDSTQDFVEVYYHNPVAYSGMLAFNDYSIMTTPKGLWVWDTDPGGGTQADYSGNSHTMTFNGTMTTTDLQLVDSGLVYFITLDGTDDYISTPDHADFSYALTNVSWEFVINVTDTAAVQIIWSKWDETTAAEDREWRIYLNATENLVTELYDETANVVCDRTSDSALSVGVHHIVIEYDGGGGATAANGITIYNGGAVEASTATNNGSFVQMRAGATPVWIGADEGTGGTAELFFQSNIGLFGVTQESYVLSDVFKLWLNARSFYAL